MRRRSKHKSAWQQVVNKKYQNSGLAQNTNPPKHISMLPCDHHRSLRIILSPEKCKDGCWHADRVRRTLIELLVVIAILVILAPMLLPA
jgi:hypothetical protein